MRWKLQIDVRVTELPQVQQLLEEQGMEIEELKQERDYWQGEYLELRDMVNTNG